MGEARLVITVAMLRGVEIYDALRAAVIELQELEAETETGEIETGDEVEIEVGE